MQISPATEVEEKDSKEDSERMFGTYTVFNISSQPNSAPLSSRQKIILFARSTYDPVTLITPLLKVPVLQAMESNSDFRTGFEGLCKTVCGIVGGRHLIPFLPTQFFFPTILKEDPRYFRKNQCSFGSRVE